MKSASNLRLIVLASIALVVPVGCSRKDQQANSEKSSQPSASQNPNCAGARHTTSLCSTSSGTGARGGGRKSRAGSGVPQQNPGSPASAFPTPQSEMAQAPPPPPPPPPAKPKTFRLPAGKVISARTTTPMTTKTVKTGDRFDGKSHCAYRRQWRLDRAKRRAGHRSRSNSDPGGRVKGVKVFPAA